MLTSMRSNDAWLGLPHDVFTFTMIQELITRSLGIELGDYKHAVGSLHIYEEHQEKAIRYLDEGWQPRKPMKPMPYGDPWGKVEKLIAFEKVMRCSDTSMQDPRDLMEPYWADLAILLNIYKAGKTPNNQNEIKRLRRRITDDTYFMYINKRYKLTSDRDQLSIFDGKLEARKELK